jgi:hypothetical protein
MTVIHGKLEEIEKLPEEKVMSGHSPVQLFSLSHAFACVLGSAVCCSKSGI